ncbi:MAG: GIY-YIG nuclease family protein [Actinopolymorphaceae bacterium]
MTHREGPTRASFQTAERRHAEVASYVYRAYDDSGVLLYVGVTGKPDARRDQHARTAPWYRLADRFTEAVYPSRSDAAVAELDAIRDERPIYNEIGTSGSLAFRITDYLVRRFNSQTVRGEDTPDELLTTTELLERFQSLPAGVLPGIVTDPHRLGVWLHRQGCHPEERKVGKNRVRSRMLVERFFGLEPGALKTMSLTLERRTEPCSSGGSSAARSGCSPPPAA